MAGSVAPAQAKKDQRAISELRLKLAGARSTSEVRQIRDQIFLVEQAQWITPEISILKAQSHDPVSLEQVQRRLDPSAVILEYVVADPRSYCLVISRTDARRSEEHTSELQSLRHLVCRLLLEKKNNNAEHQSLRHVAGRLLLEKKPTPGA